ncbi:MAG TPA: ABC transporter substrate-binding protein [Jatrophihabitans sp.]|nr:ABC transporter substrate-binding protein [Jatrophihabitans sp.]
MLNRSRLAAALLAALTAVAACSSSGSADSPPSQANGPSTTAAAFPITVDGAGGSVTISHRPTAIVSLSPTLTEMLFAVGAGGQVKAVDKNSDFPADAPHTDLDAYQLNAEAVAAYHPDLVVASGLPPAQAKQLATLHIPTLDEPAATNLRDSYQELTELGAATGRQQGAAATIASMKKQISAIVKATPQAPGGASYYYELDQTYYSVTSATFMGQVLKLLGLHSIADQAKGAAASGGYPQLSAEYILKADPDYVFLADTKCCEQSAATVAKRPGWSTLGAVRGGRVIPLDDDLASRWGPRIVDLLRTIATTIKQHPVS